MNNILIAKYNISDTFKITGRGLVFGGYITEGAISIGNFIEFTALNKTRRREIIGIEGFTKFKKEKINTGILIKCENDLEIEELKNWKPNNALGLIFNSL